MPINRRMGGLELKIPSISTLRLINRRMGGLEYQHQ